MYRAWIKWSVTIAEKQNKNKATFDYYMPCTGNVSRRCIMDDLWEEYINCTREEIEMLVHQVCFAEIIG